MSDGHSSGKTHQHSDQDGQNNPKETEESLAQQKLTDPIFCNQGKELDLSEHEIDDDLEDFFKQELENRKSKV